MAPRGAPHHSWGALEALPEPSPLHTHDTGPCCPSRCPCPPSRALVALAGKALARPKPPSWPFLSSVSLALPGSAQEWGQEQTLWPRCTMKPLSLAHLCWPCPSQPIWLFPAVAQLSSEQPPGTRVTAHPSAVLCWQETAHWKAFLTCSLLGQGREAFSINLCGKQRKQKAFIVVQM